MDTTHHNLACPRPGPGDREPAGYQRKRAG